MTMEQLASTTVTEAPRRRRNHMIWLGLLLTLVGALSYFIYFARFPALRDFPWVNLPLVIIGLLLSAIGWWRAFGQSAIYRGKALGAVGFALSLLLAGLFNLYVFSLSYRVPEPTRMTLSLTKAPDFRLMNQNGQPVRLSDYRGRKVVLTFYRGYW